MDMWTALTDVAILLSGFALGYFLTKIKRQEKRDISDETLERIRKMGVQ
jgi:hypothetical protein